MIERQPDAEHPLGVQVHQIAQAVFEQLPTCQMRCEEAIDRYSQARGQLRTHFAARIRPIVQVPASSLCAVDGTHEVIETTGLTVTLLVAVAVHNVEIIAQRSRVILLPPIDEADLLAGDLRTRLELGLLAALVREHPQRLHLLDGSIVSLYLTLRRLLRRQDADQRAGRPNWWSSVPDLVDRQALVDDWRTVLESKHVIAHPKRVTTRRDVDSVAALLPTILQSDVVLWSTVLLPNEHTTPVPLMSRPARVPEAFWGLPLRERTAITDGHRYWQTVYARIQPYGPALRLEVTQSTASALNAQLATIQAALSVGEIMEPIPQYLADAICKGQRKVLHALVNGVHNGLLRDRSHELVQLWMGSWRTT
jgi:hypothetical protein